jgi:hypothetical protein
MTKIKGYGVDATKNISKTCIAFCWYCFGRDTAKARHRYANNIGYVIMLITGELKTTNNAQLRMID